MPAPSFVHLRLHSEYSVVDGTLRIDEAVAAAAADGMPALAITDLSNAFGLIKFYRAARAAGIKPIAGCDVWITHDNERDLPYRAILLAADRGGYLRLCDWMSRAFRTNQHRGRAELRREWFDEGTDGLIALVGRPSRRRRRRAACKATRSPPSARRARGPRGSQSATNLECSARAFPDDDALVAATVGIASELALAGGRHASRSSSRRATTSARTRRACASRRPHPRRHAPAAPLHRRAVLHDAGRDGAKFADLPQALANTVAIAPALQPRDPARQELPAGFPDACRRHHRRAPAQRGRAGLERRLASLYPEPQVREQKRPSTSSRLDFETATIVQMGFAGYFLIVATSSTGPSATTCRWVRAADRARIARRVRARHHRPRSRCATRCCSSASSIPSGVDARLRHRLLPGRRDRVIDYVKQKYGADSVSQIATFGTPRCESGRARRRAACSTFRIPFVDGIAKLIPFQPGKLVTLKRREGEPEANVIYAREVEPLINERESAEEKCASSWHSPSSSKGLPRNVGMHAGGVLIAPGKLTEFCPLYVQPNADAIISQFDKDDVEAVGLVKFDFLGPHDAHDPRLDHSLRAHARSVVDRRPRFAAARRPGRVLDLPHRQHRRRVPVRIARHARAPEAGAGHALRGHHRARRAVPPRPDGAHSRLRRAQVRDASVPPTWTRAWSPSCRRRTA
jgi:DNA polymerase-3 subunit alpha